MGQRVQQDKKGENDSTLSLSLSLSHMLTSKTRAKQITPYNPTRDHTPYQEESTTKPAKAAVAVRRRVNGSQHGAHFTRGEGERANELDCLVTVRTATANVTWEQSMTCDMRRCRRGEEKEKHETAAKKLTRKLTQKLSASKKMQCGYISSHITDSARVR